MPKYQIFCKKCNEKFNSMQSFRDHICPNEEIAPKWNTHVGRRHGFKKAHKQYLDDHWITKAEEQRKKKKHKPDKLVYKNIWWGR